MVKALVTKEKLNKKEWSIIIVKNEDFIKAQAEVVKLTRESNDN